MARGKKVSILGAGHVGATIAYTLTLDGMASEVVLLDTNKDKAKGEVLDIIQGTAFFGPVNIHSGEYEDMANSDVVVVTLGLARKPGQSRMDLAQANVDLVKQVIPDAVKHAPDAVYVVVSNPVDILTYTLTKISGLPDRQIVGSGTILDSARLRTGLAKHASLPPRNVHAYVFGEHGDTSVVPWSLATIAGMEMNKYCEHICANHGECGKAALKAIEDDVRTAGAKVIGLKGATYYAVSMSVLQICAAILRDECSIFTLSALLHGQYGLEDVALSLPVKLGAGGVEGWITPPLLPDEAAALKRSADALKEVIRALSI
ncbi:MAG: L-lactate dehydrogenase [Acidobacteriota bacterium]|jgi:L-lactate dehydrogenase|nr:L-lactate dehydrogenase [Acidobacteriota bacterium]